MHVKWNRQLDGCPMTRSDQFLSCQKSLKNLFKWRLFKKTSGYSDSLSERIIPCTYVGRKLEFHYTCFLSSSTWREQSILPSFEMLIRNISEDVNDRQVVDIIKKFHTNQHSPQCENHGNSNSEVFSSDTQVSCISECSLSDSLELSFELDDVWTKLDKGDSRALTIIGQSNLLLESRGKSDSSDNKQKRPTKPDQRVAAKVGTPAKFVSKIELVKEIQELGATCESRTKELNFLKMQLRHTTLGFEALAMLNKHITEQYDPFIQPILQKQYERAKDELSKSSNLIQLYQVQLKDMKNVHSAELSELSEKLTIFHKSEIKDIKSKHGSELREIKSNHEHQVQKLKEAYRNESQDNEDKNRKSLKELQDEYNRNIRELKEVHHKKLQQVSKHHQHVNDRLQKELINLHSKYNSLRVQMKSVEEVFMKDKNARIQHMSAKKLELEKEVESLKAVLDMKSSQIQDLNYENLKIKEKLEELPVAKHKIRELEGTTEGLKAIMTEKNNIQRDLTCRNEELIMNYEKETRNNRTLSMVNEELQWKLQQSNEDRTRSTSLMGSQEMWKDEDIRSSSRLSLPIMQSSRQRSMTDVSSISQTLSDNQSSRPPSMSASWHQALPTHNESKTSCRMFVPYFDSAAKLPVRKQKKNSVIKHRSHSATNLPTDRRSMSMSWAGEHHTKFYDELDEANPEVQSIAEKNKTKEFSPGTNGQPQFDLENDIDGSSSSMMSMQSSIISLSESSNSCANNAESSSSCESKNNEFVVNSSIRNFAGESLVEDIQPNQSIIPNQKNLSQLNDIKSIEDINVSTTTSAETSSELMADSMHLDVSWEDEESENES